MPGPDPAREAERAAAEAARIGGSPSSAGEGQEGLDEAQRPLAEAGQGEAEGFEQAEQELIDKASHGDQHGARRAVNEAALESDDARAVASAEADHERSSEREDDSG